MNASGTINLVLAILLSPLLVGIINRTKAFFAGRQGPPLMQLYFDIWKLLHKSAVYSRTTTWVFRAGPIVGLAAALLALAIMPLGRLPALAAFPGDVIVFAYLLALMRFFTVLAALDTASAFEGMGASREVQFSVLAEPALLVGLAAVAKQTDSLCLSTIFASLPQTSVGAAIFLVIPAWLVVYLTENARIPIDDPNTHLELTMIHEVMVLDHCGVDLAFIEYASALKLWLLGTLLAAVAVPFTSGFAVLDGAMVVAAVFVLAVVTGVIESWMARLRLLRVPQLLVGAAVLSVLALVLVLR